MAVLATQGHKKLGLTNASDNKQLVFVKLTDSSYEALSNYIQNQAKLSSSSRVRICDSKSSTGGTLNLKYLCRIIEMAVNLPSNSRTIPG